MYVAVLWLNNVTFIDVHAFLVCVCMYVYMYVCMKVCSGWTILHSSMFTHFWFVHMYVCMYTRVLVCGEGRNTLITGVLNKVELVKFLAFLVCAYVCMCVCTHACMYYICVFVCSEAETGTHSSMLMHF